VRVNTFLRVEAFNALKRVNLGNPVATQNSANFMRIAATRAFCI
jgi:hypothetical protein